MLEVYSMYDNKADIYNKPMYVKNYLELTEALQYTLAEDQGENINAVDYEVYQLGEYYTSTGKYELFDAPKHMGSLNMFNKKQGTENEG